jgi:hypothetical protein
LLRLWRISPEVSAKQALQTCRCDSSTQTHRIDDLVGCVKVRQILIASRQVQMRTLSEVLVRIRTRLKKTVNFNKIETVGL